MGGGTGQGTHWYVEIHVWTVFLERDHVHSHTM